MNNLINKTHISEPGIAICRPVVSYLDVERDESGGRTLYIHRTGGETLVFPLNKEATCHLVALLSDET